MKLNPWPIYEQDEIDSVVEVLESGKVNYWTGEKVKQFEVAFAEYHNQKHAIALANGTLALELALKAFDIGEGDEVITTSRTFIASASCVVQVGAVPVIADIERNSQNISVKTIESLITSKTKAIICVHLAGWPCDMNGIMELSKKHNLIVIEDCAQAHGAKIQNKIVGSFGHASAFSFCQDKIMSTGGEGGMLVLDDEIAYKKAWAFKDHGKSFDAVYNTEHPPGFRWLHESFGTNWRMTEMQAAIGLLQLKKLSGWVQRRNEIANIYLNELKELAALRIPRPDEGVYHAYYRFYGFIEQSKLKTDYNRDRIMLEIQEQGLVCLSGSCGEIYLEKAFTDSDFGPGERLEVAQELSEQSLCFLTHHTLTDEMVYKSCKIIKSVILSASK